MEEMYICPNCNALVNSSEDACPECDEDLTLYSDEDLQAGFIPEIIFSAESLAEAQAIVEFLRNNDIPSTYLDFDSPLREQLRETSSDSVPVIVHKDTAEKAIELVDEYMSVVPVGDSDDEDWSDEEGEIEDDDEYNDIGHNQIA
ncbi:MAG TPA: hypothetical protein PKV16_04425 [Caldisericia bacterium]|nr:hypothetical protein [Caldisericia bacterium]HPF48555.1 hypothetical protein [Caldisericia bacterium]HPI83785.1 hypothetical protein [Caldisericia bacterium]HPQ93010.1 hypothetical protein [Caldisericia bacterium]HRV75157.1 hypothetical protein [Caldisericia bacterium]